MLKIYGVSDDLVEWEIGERSEEIDCYDADVMLTVGLTDNEYSEELQQGVEAHGIIIKMRYGTNNSCWSAEIVQIEEGILCPWPISILTENYTVVVIIDCPIDTPIKHKVSR